VGLRLAWQDQRLIHGDGLGGVHNGK